MKIVIALMACRSSVAAIHSERVSTVASCRRAKMIRVASPRHRCLASDDGLDTWCRNCRRRKHRTRAKDRQARTPLPLCKLGKISVAVIDRP
jgi:hypothetical protein